MNLKTQGIVFKPLHYGTKGGGSTADLAKREHDGSTVEGVIDHVVGHQNP
jgi:hypothetical protein